MNSLDEITTKIKNQKCWRPWRGAGFAVYFELGDKLTNHKNEEPSKGTYTIGLTVCPWYVFKRDKLIFGVESSYEEIDKDLKIFKGKTLQEIQFDEKKYEAKAIFSDGLSIKIHYSDLRDEWCILTPKVELIISREKTAVSPSEINLL